MKTPEFWDKPQSRLSQLLTPCAWLYQKVVSFKQKRGCREKGGYYDFEE